MKRMNEVFELPVNHEWFAVDGHTAKNGEGLTARLEADLYATHAINNVDSLADALEDALLQIEHLHIKFGKTGSGIAVISRGDAALNAYRGVK